MSQFTCRLDETTEEELSKIMKKANIATKNGCIEMIIKKHSILEANLQDKKNECYKLERDYNELYSMLMNKIEMDNRLLEWHKSNR